MYEIVNVQYTGTYNNGGTSIPAVLGEFRASSAADLPAQNVDCHIICGCDGLDIATGDRYIWNGTAWILQPSDRAFSNVYTKPEIDSMTTEIYGVIAYYHTVIVSDTGEITFYSLGGNVGTWAIYGNGQQTGTPTPDAPIQPDFSGKLVGTDWTIPISNAGQTVPVYLGQVSTTRRVRKLVLTGDEWWGKEGGALFFNDVIIQMPAVQYADAYCSHYRLGTSYTDVAVKEAAFGVSQRPAIFIHDTRFSTIADFKAYLADQYDAGTPVTVWYVLSSPETGIVNEPLCKIGGYADELHLTKDDITIPTVRGENTLTIDTDLPPSKIELSGER